MIYIILLSFIAILAALLVWFGLQCYKALCDWEECNDTKRIRPKIRK